MCEQLVLSIFYVCLFVCLLCIRTYHVRNITSHVMDSNVLLHNT